MKKNIIIPNTDLNVLPLGLGTALAGLSFDGQEADRLFDTFLYLGGNMIDTARVYSDWVKPEIGRSERVIGDWLHRSKKRHETVIVTKGGHPDMTVENPDLHQNRMGREDMRHDLEASLRALQTDYIDLYFYHRDDTSQPVEELIEGMEQFVREGKIRYYGCSNWSTKRMEEADTYCKKMGYRGLAANQALYNMGSRYMKPLSDDTMVKADEGMLSYHKENANNVLMPYMGVCGGFFHKYITGGQEAVENSPYFVKENLEIAKRVKLLTGKYSATVSQVVLGFFTQQETFCIPLYGPKNIAQIEEAVGMLDIAFEKADFS